MDGNGLKAAMDRKTAEYLADLKGAGRAEETLAELAYKQGFLDGAGWAIEPVHTALCGSEGKK